jgi:hypothetical protein
VKNTESSERQRTSHIPGISLQRLVAFSAETVKPGEGQDDVVNTPKQRNESNHQIKNAVL